LGCPEGSYKLKYRIQEIIRVVGWIGEYSFRVESWKLKNEKDLG
jgi:hypothetical protein